MNKGKNILNKIHVLVMIIALFLPLIFINRVNGKVSSAENRVLASFPKLHDKSGNLIDFDTLVSSTNNWLNDNIGFRDEMLELNARLRYSIFKQSSVSKVLIGKEDWLFFNNVNDGDPIGDYTGTIMFTESQMNNILERLNKIQDLCNKQGKKFVLMLIPNKEYVYSQFLPDGIRENQNIKRIDQLYEYLKKNSDILIVYPYEALKDSERLTYYKYDTHWNSYGAYLGYAQLMTALDLPVKTFEQFNPENSNMTKGDLSEMAMISSAIPSYHEDKVTFSEGVSCDYSEGQSNISLEVFHNKSGKSNILFVGDSFRTAIKPLLSDFFSESVFSHHDMGDLTELMAEYSDSDVVVYEVVERYLDKLLNIQ